MRSLAHCFVRLLVAIASGDRARVCEAKAGRHYCEERELYAEWIDLGGEG